MNIFVSGSTGFIGQRLLPLLTTDPNRHLFLLVRDAKKILDKNMDYSKMTLIKGDLSEIDVWGNILKEVDVVIHLAGSLSLFEKNHILSQSILSGTVKLLKKCLDTKKKIHFVYSSSVEAYGPKESKLPVKISCHDENPTSDYGRIKLETEKKIADLCKNSAVNYTILRIGNVYDKNEGILGYLINTCQTPLLGYLLTKGLGDFTLSLIHRDDLSEIIVRVIKTDKCLNKSYYTTAETHSVSEILSMIKMGSPEEGGNTSFLASFLVVLFNTICKFLRYGHFITYLSLSSLKRKYRNFDGFEMLNDLGYIPKIKLKDLYGF